MTKQERKKARILFDTLLEKGIDPEKITRNNLFLAIIRQYLDGERSVKDVVEMAVKINILAGDKYKEADPGFLVA